LIISQTEAPARFTIIDNCGGRMIPVTRQIAEKGIIGRILLSAKINIIVRTTKKLLSIDKTASSKE